VAATNGTSVSLRPEVIWVFRIADANITAKKILLERNVDATEIFSSRKEKS
jgi:hypothetical protein